MTDLFLKRGIQHVFHYAPLHYLLFLARAGCLYSKPALREQGFRATHFRRTSRDHDEVRGFGEYVHLTLRERPPILQAKMEAGFPHFELRVPVRALKDVEFHLCRFNIAKCRYLNRPGGTPAQEGPANGRYYGNRQLPIAVSAEERESLMRHNYPGAMIEVLVSGFLQLPDDTEVRFFSAEDHDLGERLIRETKRPWKCSQSTEFKYAAAPRYHSAVLQFLSKAKSDPDWKGDGLEFDSV